MEKCIYCGLDTDKERMLFEVDDIEEVGELDWRYCCDICIEDKVRKEREAFKPIYGAFIKYLKDNKYRIECKCYKIKGYSCKIKTEYFKITDELERYVDTIRRRMKKKKAHEVWIDPCWIKYNGETFEFIEYLCFDSNDKKQEWRFYFKLVNYKDDTYKDIEY